MNTSENAPELINVHRFRFLTAHERVVNSYIGAFMYIHLMCFSEDSYQESTPGNEKRKAR